MAARPGTALYSPQLLALAASLARFPLDREFAHRGEARSRTCGSTIEIGFETSSDGAVERVGMMVAACAVGQASAAILAASVRGRSAADMTRAATAVSRWLEESDAPLPDWPGFEALVPAREHRGRHGALLMPWNAAAQALSTVAASG